MSGSEHVWISLVVTARGARDLQHQWYLATAFGNIGCHGYLATLRKQGQLLLAALQAVFAGRPLYPALG